MQPLKAGVFAAGVGTRLRAAAADATVRTKALTPIAGRALIEWVLLDLIAAGAAEIVVLVNEASTSVRDHVRRAMPDAPVSWVVESPPTSMHSFLRVLDALAGGGDRGPFLMSTVDTIAPPGTFARFVDAARRAQPADVVLALTAPAADDNPLRIAIGPPRADGSSDVLAVGEGELATAGYYFVQSTLAREADAAIAANLPALRAFLRWTLDHGCSMRGVRMPDSVDVDRPDDVAAAARLLAFGSAVAR